MIIYGGLELLPEEEARALLKGSEVGRIGISIGALPAIFPVNYRLVDGAIVFRTAPGSKLSAAASGAVVAFEVDDHGALDRSGWSVLVIGRAEVVEDPDVVDQVTATGLQPFVDGALEAIVRIEPMMLSGPPPRPHLAHRLIPRHLWVCQPKRPFWSLRLTQRVAPPARSLP